MNTIRNILAVLIPGVGKILRRKYFSGAVILILWIGALDAYVLMKNLNPSGVPLYVEPALLAALISTFAANATNEVLHIGRQQRNLSTGRVDELYSRALAAFVAGEDRSADDLLRSALRLDELNVDCLFLRGQVAGRLGRNHRARRLLRKCGDFDENGKWKWEISAILERL